MSTIQLGAPGALRKYLVKARGDGIMWGRGPAQPFAAKVNSSGKYDEVDIWNEWVQEDWQGGVGKIDPQEGGYLYADVETRVPNQVVLSPLVRMVDQNTLANTTADCRYMPDDMAGEIAVTGTGANSRVAIKFTTPGTLLLSTATYWVYAYVPTGVSMTMAVYTDSSGPNTLVDSSTISGGPGLGWYWYGVSLDNSGTLSTSTAYWLVIYPTTNTNTITVGYGTSGYNAVAKQYNGSSWADITGKYIIYTSNQYPLALAAGNKGAGFFRFNSKLYSFSNAYVWEYDSVNDEWDAAADLVDGGDNMADVRNALPWNALAWFASGGSADDKAFTMNASKTTSYASLNANLFARHGRYFYRAHENDLYYTADGVSWTGPFQVGTDEYDITGMAGMGDSLYMATPEALYRFAPGDFVEGVTTWGSLEPTNGMHMTAYAGSIYVVVNGRVANITPDGQVIDIWIKRDDDFVAGRIGRVWSISVMNNWIVALVGGASAPAFPTLWAYLNDAWHHLATLPSTTGSSGITVPDYGCYYDRSTQHVWVITPEYVTFKVRVPDYAFNPYNDTSSVYMPRGWFEQDRFYGGQYLLDKDWDGVSVIGDLSSTLTAKIYWQDEDSSAWEALGTADTDGELLRWTDYTTRPNGRWIKFGMLLGTNDGSSTPRLRALSTKFLPMVNDRFRDNVTITLHDYITFPDGTHSPYTRAEQWTHLDSMIRRVPPLIYQDPFGTQYEVKVVDWNCNTQLYNSDTGAGQLREMEVNLVLEQTPDTSYTA